MGVKPDGTADAIQDDLIEETADQPIEETGEKEEGASEEGQQEGASESEEGGELVVSFGDEKPPEDDENRAPDWVRELRKTNRQLVRQLKERDEENARLKGSTREEAPIVVGEEPTMESVDFDADRFATEYRAWVTRKAAAETAQAKKKAAEDEAQQEWQKKVSAYEAGKAKIKVRDFDEAEEAVKDSLSVTQQAIILDAAEDSPMLVYALGKNPKKAQELAAIKNPVKFAAAIGKLETQLKVQPKKTAPTPERVVRSTAAVAGAVDSQLERLREEAARTGDHSQVLKYKATLRAKQNAA